MVKGRNKMKLIKSYKKLYKQELENRKMLIMQNSKISEENVNYQKQIKKLEQELQTYKELSARVRIELSDMDGLLEQETKAKEELLKQRTQLRKMITKLGGDWKNATK